MTAGSTIYLPVWNDGALFSTGDGHAAQGHGEVNGTAIETALKGTFEFHVRKDLGWKLPRAETPTHYIAFGLDADLDDAARQALSQMIDWVVSLTGIPRDEAYALCSFAADLHVTQTVNNVKGVHAMIAEEHSAARRLGKSLLSSSAKADDPVATSCAVSTGCPACAGHDGVREGLA